jgi:hypothetical protein
MPFVTKHQDERARATEIGAVVGSSEPAYPIVYDRVTADLYQSVA